MIPCVYLGEETGKFHRNRGLYACSRHKLCIQGRGFPDMVGCRRCKERLQIGDAGFADRWVDPLRVTRRDGEAVNLQGILAGGAAFLVCGGPSATPDIMEGLSTRGTFSLAVNNKAGDGPWRPQAFVCSDPPMKFSHSIWLDPAIMKFIPTPKLMGGRGKLRMKKGKQFLDMEKHTPDCPNTWGFERRSWMKPDDSFFTEPSAPWGNHKQGVAKTGLAKVVCTMLCGLRILRYLGARTIFLVGVDFRMTPKAVYSFDQGKEEGGCISNNSQFAVVNDWLCKMVERGCFERFGLQVYNCYERSGLRAFDYAPFDQALTYARGSVEMVPDLSYWYEKVAEEPAEG